MTKGDDSVQGLGDHSIPGALLFRLRRKNGWTLAEVSKRTGVAVSTLSKIENGKSSPNYDVLLRLCRGLDLNPADFFVRVAAGMPERIVIDPEDAAWLGYPNRAPAGTKTTYIRAV